MKGQTSHKNRPPTAVRRGVSKRGTRLKQRVGRVMTPRVNRLVYNTEYNKDLRTRRSTQWKGTEVTDIYFDAHSIKELLKRGGWVVKPLRGGSKLLNGDTAGRPPPSGRPFHYLTPLKFLGNLGGVK